MKIKKISNNKKQYLNLLLLGDEQENMIDKYLDKGDMYVLYEDKAVAQCVVTCNGNNVYEIKNLSVLPDYQRKGYGKALIDFVFNTYKGKELIVGTGESPATLIFYEKCGFSYSHRIKNFFTDNYHKPIYEEGVLLEDMVYLKKLW